MAPKELNAISSPVFESDAIKECGAIAFVVDWREQGCASDINLAVIIVHDTRLPSPYCQFLQLLQGIDPKIKKLVHFRRTGGLNIPKSSPC
jgi:hypothetical protein